ncbi:unnamed protein product [Cochlearia groenlandica]
MSNNESYPPVFRRVTIAGDSPPTAESKPVLIQDKDIDIPVIDLERLDHMENKLTETCKEWGIFRLVNHGVPFDLTSKVQEISESLLGLPFDDKREMFTAVNSPLTYFWGTPALKPSGDALKRGTRQGSNVNMVEGFNVRLSKLSGFTFCDGDDDDDGVRTKLDSFRVLMEEYGNHITRIAISLFEAMAQTLDLDLSGDQRPKYLSESTGLIRVYRYPARPDQAEDIGMEVHTDSSVISIIKEDEVGGLEITKGEEWYRVKPVANTLVVNLGDMMQAISDDEYKSVKHRVKIQKYMKRERHSLCYFVFPKRDCVIKSSKYKPFTYSEFEAQVQTDVQSLGTKIGLSRFTP